MLEVIDDVGGESGAGFVEAEHDAGGAEFAVESAGDESGGFEEFGESLEREEVRLQRDKDFAGCCEGVDSEDAQRWWAVHDDVIKALLIAPGLHGAAEEEFASLNAGEFDFCGGQIDVCGDE